jgi:hypothetical protein
MMQIMEGYHQTLVMAHNEIFRVLASVVVHNVMHNASISADLPLRGICDHH